MDRSLLYFGILLLVLAFAAGINLRGALNEGLAIIPEKKAPTNESVDTTIEVAGSGLTEWVLPGPQVR